MPDVDPFEHRLEARLAAYLADAVRPFDAAAIARSAATAGGGRLRPAPRRPFLPQRGVLWFAALIVALAVVAGALAFVGGALPTVRRLIDADPTVPVAPATGSPTVVPASGLGGFVLTGSMSVPRSQHTATLLADGRVLVVGGTGEDGAATSAEVWDPATGAFTTIAPPLHPRVGAAAVRLRDGRVLVVGGGAAAAEVWDPVTGQWSEAGDLLTPRLGHTATLLRDGRVLVIGGCASGEYSRCEDGVTAEVWDPATGRFERTGTLAAPRIDHAATLMPDGRVLVTGGITPGTTPDDFAGAGFERLRTSELWDPATGTFSPGPALEDRRTRHSATLLEDGRVLVIGGTSIDPERSGYPEIWDPATPQFRRAMGQEHARIGHAAVLLRDGRVLVAGGMSGEGDAPTELWVPGDERFLEIEPLLAPRVQPTLTLLDDGRVLVVGGREPGYVQSSLDAVEIFVP